MLVSHLDGWGAPHQASEPSLEAVLGALGPAPRAGLIAPCQRTGGDPGSVTVTTAAAPGTSTEVRWEPLEGEPGEAGRAQATSGAAGEVRLGDDLDFGVYAIQVEADGVRAAGTFVHAPAVAPPLPHGWGLFAPWHAIHDSHAVAHGDADALGRLAGRVEAAGGVFTATLPLLPRFLEPARVAGQPVAYEPSPYAPVSRQFWDELLVAAAFAPAVDPGAFVEPGRVWQQAWPGLVDAARPHHEATERWLAEDPERSAYAAFRGEGDAERRLTYGWAQRSATERMEALGARRALLLDLPLGTHGRGFDVTRHPKRFVEGLSVGAPPDALFGGGQNWAFPPMRLERAARDGFAHLRRCLELHMRSATVLRVDHVAWLHRLYCIPAGADATHGVYVQQPPWVTESLYGILTLLGHRHRCAIVGEDLGTVPPEVREAMARGGLARSWVLQLELAEPEPAPIPAGSLVSANTHDLPLFAAWWAGDDVHLFREIGLLDAAAEARALERRSVERDRLRRRLDLGAAEGPATVLGAALEWLGASAAGAVMVAMEDLWLEPRPQNVPGTSSAERPNWRGRAARPLEALAELRTSALAPQLISQPQARAIEPHE